MKLVLPHKGIDMTHIYTNEKAANDTLRPPRINGRIAVMQTTLYAIYIDNFGAPNTVTTEVELHHPWSTMNPYQYVYGISDKSTSISRWDYFKSRAAAEDWLLRAARLARFSGASGLHPVKATKAHEQIVVPDWADHKSYWQDENGTALVMIEPMEHCQGKIALLDRTQFTYTVVPRSLVPYHAPEETERFGMLFTSAADQSQLSEVASRLELAVQAGGCL